MTTIAQLFADATKTLRRQRLALLAIVTPFYAAFALGWMTRTPAALFIGAIGLVAITAAYRRYAPKHSPKTKTTTTQETET